MQHTCCSRDSKRGYLGVVLLEASRSEKDEAGEVGGLTLQAPGHSVDEQGSPSQAVPYSP